MEQSLLDAIDAETANGYQKLKERVLNVMRCLFRTAKQDFFAGHALQEIKLSQQMFGKNGRCLSCWFNPCRCGTKYVWFVDETGV